MDRNESRRDLKNKQGGNGDLTTMGDEGWVPCLGSKYGLRVASYALRITCSGVNIGPNGHQGRATVPAGFWEGADFCLVWYSPCKP